ncbi:hypothetical protein EV663_11664 [Rhodovulum bhavnagarense]|uniref:Uncharacterized protein n=1 Tax=Rhodovulum bhavnagarense TaxID=992286 RepID=A0A4R2RC13_9RHOB|nr:hypothetical protein [Rhodovulum bhavnagarense]TCP59768.1 hypothetical protein EV663_11664 [Rhodovulum bhavnagarense]
MLPATVDPTRGNIVTSYEGAPPEQALAAAVVLRALEDLGSSDETERFEAHEWFLQRRGPWAASRRFWLTLAGLDEEQVHDFLTRHLDPPERPEKSWTYMEIFDILPTDRPFTYQSEVHRTTLHVSQFQTRIANLIKVGAVVRLEPGVFCVAGSEQVCREHLARVKKDALEDLFDDA